jgi:pre-mRNA-processing factor SLU7
MTTDIAAVRKVAKAGKAERKDDDFGSSDDEDEDEEKYADAADAVGQKLDTKTRITVRNLRIREDTAKYLINLDPSSAYYDPKTRSMRDNPEGNKQPEDVRFHFLNLPRSHHQQLSSHGFQGRISLAPLVKPATYRASNSLPGNLRNAVTISMSMPTQRKARSYTNSL